jgi:hypothetical protein
MSASFYSWQSEKFLLANLALLSSLFHLLSCQFALMYPTAHTAAANKSIAQHLIALSLSWSSAFTIFNSTALLPSFLLSKRLPR